MVKEIVLLIILWAAFLSTFVLGEEKPPTWVPTPEERALYPWIPAPDEVFIEDVSVSMPLGRILLTRKGSEYCALKFTNTWLGETKEDHYSSYEFNYQGDGSSDFSKSNVVSGTDELFYPWVRMWARKSRNLCRSTSSLNMSFRSLPRHVMWHSAAGYCMRSGLAMPSLYYSRRPDVNYEDLTPIYSQASIQWEPGTIILSRYSSGVRS